MNYMLRLQKIKLHQHEVRLFFNINKEYVIMIKIKMMHAAYLYLFDNASFSVYIAGDDIFILFP